MPDPHVIRERYCATAPGYDELYSQEQREKYNVILNFVKLEGILADIGAGTCLFEEYLVERGQAARIEYIIALDLTDCMLQYCRERLARLNLLYKSDIVVADADFLPLRDKSVDYVVAVTVFDLAKDTVLAVREAERISKRLAIYTLLKRVEARRAYTLCEVYIGETDKDVICLPRAFKQHKHNASFAGNESCRGK